MSYIKGIDISNNNGSIDFSSVASDGVEIVLVKASEGQSFQDSTMATFAEQAKANGMKIGAYHFLVSTSTPEAQAQNFYSMIKDTEWDCIPFLDVETMSGFDADTLCDYVKRFKETFESLSPLTLGLYTYTSFIGNLSGAMDVIADMPFWEANYNDDPWNLASNSFTNRIGHQYTETGSISGVSENCDVDSFTDGVYIDSSTIAGAWIQKDNKWWYRHNDGTYTQNDWEHIDGKWYFFDVEGWMAYDWKKDGDNWYLLGNSNDGQMKYGWSKVNGVWYYFGDKNDGAMKTGWQKIDGNWYYFNKDGSMATGWIVADNEDYLLYSTGQMVCNTDYIGYRFDAKGHPTKLS